MNPDHIELLCHAAVLCAWNDKSLKKKEFRSNNHPLGGTCYIISEAIYHLSGKILEPHQLKHENVSHWYLIDPRDGAIIDPTYQQFEEIPDYNLGRKKAFLTKQPSKRASLLISKIKLTFKILTRNM